MNLTKFLHSFLVIFVLLSSCFIQATTLIKGDGTSPYSFDETITAQVFDYATGTFFIGLTGGGNTFSLSSFTRTQPTSIPTFTGIATSTTISSQPIELLALATTQGNLSPNLAFTIFNATPLTQTEVSLTNNRGTILTQSAVLNDASGFTASDGIVALAGNSAFIYAAVRPSNGN